jgi:MarR family 2-MHQ and catechol resistance regulon transcriptional repressor
MDSNSTKDLAALIREITWSFGARGLKGECCGDLCSMQEIAKDLGFTKGGATRIVNRLEKKGYIERQRSSEDGRVCCVKVTSPGSLLVKSVSRENEERIERIMFEIDPGMQEVIKTALRSFVQAIRVEDQFL